MYRSSQRKSRTRLFLVALAAFLFFFSIHTAEARPVAPCPDARPTFLRWPSPRYTQTFIAGLETRIWDLSKKLKQRMQLKDHFLFIAVHTTTRGSGRYNMVRSSKRAQAIRAALIKEGLPARKILAQGFGEECVLYRNIRMQRKNARVDFYLTKRPPRWLSGPVSGKALPQPSFRELSKYTIYYPKGQILPPVRTQRAILALIKRLQSNKMLRLRVETHNSPDEKSYTVDISKKRSRALYRIFSRHHVSSHQLGFTSYGPDRPVVSNRTKKGRTRNRRAELTLLHRVAP
ncbi:MAG: OmpA family protein [Myxococcales bacterium]|nr:OmpA family protein [Myxococcales bacterium]MCB9644742.1 OmpA family protein [Myxococcales bacterium]